MLLTSTKLNKINCDRFRTVKVKSEVYVSVRGHEKLTVRLVFKNINAIVPPNDRIRGRYVFKGVPKGEEAYIVAFKETKSKNILGFKKVILGEKKYINLEVKEISNEEFNKGIKFLLN